MKTLIWKAAIYAVTAAASCVLLATAAADQSHHRSKRYFFINPDAPITLGFLLNMPISLALPTLVDTTPRSFGHYEATERLPGYEYPDDLYVEPAYEQEVGRLQVYFSYLKILTVGCQERVVCEIAAQPNVFSPLSTLMLKELRQTHGPVKPSSSSLLWRYMAASATGYAYNADSCAEYYNQCELGAKQLINMPVLKVWQYISSKLNLKLV